MIKMESFENSNSPEDFPGEELDNAIEKIEEMKEHGSEVGISELFMIAPDHPNVANFFAEGKDVLTGYDEKELKELQEKFLKGKLTENDKKDLKNKYFIPFLKRYGLKKRAA